MTPEASPEPLPQLTTRRGWLDPLLGRLPPAWLSDAQVLRLRPLPEPLWQATLAHCPWLTWRSAEQVQHLRALTTLFLARKQFTPVAGLTLTDAMAARVAAQACLPIHAWGMGLQPYSAFVGVVLQPAQVLAHRSWADDDGVVHEGHEPLSGEAMPGGPIMLSWEDVQAAGTVHDATDTSAPKQGTPVAYNVVVHEFCHALDLLKGEADGLPPLPHHITAAHWLDTLWQAFDHFRDAWAHGDPIPLDPYGLEQGLSEFFPVLAETFFMTPKTLKAAHPEVYSLLSRYFRDDPACWAPH
jgi:Mlc titration factor MtfA (ptsG expression regulator)